MAEAHRLITAAELDEMTPDQRAAAINERIVTNWDDVPEEFRQKVIATAHRLADELGSRAGHRWCAGLNYRDVRHSRR